ncbi:MAG: type II secretion system F family protein [Thermoplasmatales archaeon]
MFDLIVSAIFVATFPLGLIMTINEQRTSAIEYQLTIFLSDLSEACKYGPSLSSCIMDVAEIDYGPLTKEVRRLSEQIRWGATLEEALDSLRDRVNSSFVSKIVSTLIELNRTGGNVSEVLSEISGSTKDAYLIQKEKYSQLSSYAVAIFISFAVFLLAVVVLDVQFFPAIIREGGVSSTFSYLNSSAIPIVKGAFSGLIIANAVGGGIMAGILRKGRIGEGLIYASLLTVLGYLVIAFIGGV